LIADDHELVRTGIKKMLADIPDLKVIAEAENAEEAIRLAKETKPNVVLMDVKMPGIEGLEATRKLLRFDRRIKVLVLTSLDDDFFSERLLKAGAAGYLTKGASIDEMVQAIRAVHTGQRYVSSIVATQLALKHINSDKSLLETLSDRELEVLMLLVNGSEMQEIAKKMNMTINTVYICRSRILKKLDVRSDVELLMLAIRYGLVDVAKLQIMPFRKQQVLHYFITLFVQNLVDVKLKNISFTQLL
jgi:two-component system, NarL family, invasion response regulator UvrY